MAGHSLAISSDADTDDIACSPTSTGPTTTRQNPTTYERLAGVIKTARICEEERGSFYMVGAFEDGRVFRLSLSKATVKSIHVDTFRAIIE